MITKQQLKRLARIQNLCNATAATLEFRKLRDHERNRDARSADPVIKLNGVDAAELPYLPKQGFAGDAA